LKRARTSCHHQFGPNHINAQTTCIALITTRSSAALAAVKAVRRTVGTYYMHRGQDYHTYDIHFTAFPSVSTTPPLSRDLHVRSTVPPRHRASQTSSFLQTFPFPTDPAIFSSSLGSSWRRAHEAKHFIGHCDPCPDHLLTSFLFISGVTIDYFTFRVI
jgi:hypothetical protein